MFLRFFGLREQPFGVTPNPRYVYQAASHTYALASLQYAIENNLGFATLIAPPGFGKTTLLFQALQGNQPNTASAFIFQTQCGPDALLQQLLAEFEVPSEGDGQLERQSALNEFLLQQAHAGRRVLVIIDEAQNLPDRTLEFIRLLSNFETPSDKLLTFVLSGQPQLANKLNRPELAQLAQRIAVSATLFPLTLSDTAAYIAHRLRIAGHPTGEIFSADSIEPIFSASGGVPRLINRICFTCLTAACSAKEPVIDAALVERALQKDTLNRSGVRTDTPHGANSACASSTTTAAYVAPLAAAASAESTPEKESPVQNADKHEIQRKPADSDAEVSAVVNPRVPPAARTLDVSPPIATPSPESHQSTVLGDVTPPPPASSQQPAQSTFVAPQHDTDFFREKFAAAAAVATASAAGPRPVPKRRFNDWPWFVIALLAAAISVVFLLTQLRSSPAMVIGKPEQPQTANSSAPAQKAASKTSRTGAASKPSKARGTQNSTQPQRQAAAPAVNPPPDAPMPATAEAEKTSSAAELPQNDATSTAVSESSNIVPPRLLSSPAPRYPQLAVERGLAGRVLVRARIDEHGKVAQTHVLQGEELLARAALQALRTWRYAPAISDGRPVGSETTVEIVFSLPN